ncbi:hypothetical protein MCANUFG1_02206 [Mycoplasmopsis canis UFG1]|uniref:hypothetical protein n=1 Tax=Mycoplasmopsis canis TaxID=29555 RepID=UPI00025B0135|nr:hypothetical protein [Mycoplasmopsis canis]EIE41649.1 hypothetical protein MCANUFG1_02206 [Mycoplasmopsis canis UFG1]
MASTYDFKNILKELKKAENNLDKFENSLNKLANNSQQLKFNSSRYGAHELEKKISNSFQNADSEIEKEVSKIISNIVNITKASKDKMRIKINEQKQRIIHLNKELRDIYEINLEFINSNYEETIKLAKKFYGGTKASNYVTLLMLESYTKLCSGKINNFMQEDFDFYLDFYVACKRSNSKKYIIYARKYLFYAAWLMIKLFPNNLNDEEKYKVIKKGFDCFLEFDDDEKIETKTLYDNLYSAGIELYNNFISKAYNNFAYDNVKALLVDSKYFKNEDIKLEFFKDSNSDSAKIFRYILDKGDIADNSNIKKAFKDTLNLALSENKQEYFDYWISVYDLRGWEFLEEIINIQEDRLTISQEILTSLRKSVLEIKKIAELFLNIAENIYNYLKSLDKKISLDNFVFAAPHLNEIVILVTNAKIEESENETVIKGRKILDDILFGMIFKYRRKCSIYNEQVIKDLNKVLQDSSSRLDRPKLKKLIKFDKSKKHQDKTDIYVKLVTEQILIKNKKIMMWVIIAGVTSSIILTILLLVLFLVILV